MTAPDGSLADTCRECQDLDRRGRSYRVAKPTRDPPHQTPDIPP